MRIGRDVRDLGHVVRDLGEVLDRALGQAVRAHLQHQVRGDGDQIRVAGALAVAVHDALDLEDAVIHRDEGVRHRAAGVVVHVDPQTGIDPRADLVDDAGDVAREHAPVRVAQHEPLGARPPAPPPTRGIAKTGSLRYPSKKCSASKNTRRPWSRRNATESRTIATPSSRSVCSASGHVHVRRLADETDDLGPGVEQLAQHGAVRRALAGLARHAERGERGVAKRLLRGELEELGVARVRARPATLDVGHAELIDLVQDPQAILDRVRQAGALRAVAQRRVVQLHLGGRTSAVMPSPPRPRGRRPRRS